MAPSRWNFGITWSQLGLTAILAGDSQQAVADYQAGIDAAPDDPLCHNQLAWLLSTCPDEAVRDGKRAVELATKACELTEWKDIGYLDKLAAAFAEAADFDKAVEWQQKVMDDPAAHDRPDFEDMEARLKLYQSGQAYHEPAPSDDPGERD